MESYLRELARASKRSPADGDPFWRDDYSVLMRKWLDIFPTSDMPINERFNAYTRFGIVAVLLTAAAMNNAWVILTIPVVMILIAMDYEYVMQKSEQFEKRDASDPFGTYDIRIIDGIKCRGPTEDNPFMTPNYLVDPPEVLALPACSSVTKDAYVEGRKMYDDRTPYDIDNAVSGTDESARRFFALYTIGAWPPSTEAFARWLNGGVYEDTAADGYGYSCKEHDDSAPKYKYSCSPH